MLEIEDILAALAGRSQWFATGSDDKRRQEFQQFTGVLRDLESTLLRIRSGDPLELSRGRRPNGMATATGTQTRPRSNGSSISAIAAEAVAGMPKIEWAAMLWAINADTASYDALHRRLLGIARRSYGRDGFWPASIERKHKPCERMPAADYVPDLVTLALMELREPNILQTHHRRAEWFQLSQQHWRKVVNRPYLVLQAQCFNWFAGGCGHVRRRLGRARADVSNGGAL